MDIPFTEQHIDKLKEAIQAVIQPSTGLVFEYVPIISDDDIARKGPFVAIVPMSFSIGRDTRGSRVVTVSYALTYAAACPDMMESITRHVATVCDIADAVSLFTDDDGLAHVEELESPDLFDMELLRGSAIFRTGMTFNLVFYLEP